MNHSAPSHYKERRDCSVRAVSRALQIEYEEAHELCKKAGRPNGKGFHPFRLLGLNECNRIKESAVINDKKLVYHDRIKKTIKTFIKENPIGTFICVKRGHAFTIINGEIFGQKLDYSRLIYYISVTDLNQPTKKLKVGEQTILHLRNGLTVDEIVAKGFKRTCVLWYKSKINRQ